MKAACLSPCSLTLASNIDSWTQQSYALMKLDGTFDSVMTAIRQEFLANEAKSVKSQAESLFLPRGAPCGQHHGGNTTATGTEAKLEATAKGVSGAKVGTVVAAKEAALHWRLISSGYYMSARASTRLLIQNAPKNVTLGDLESIFSQFDGLVGLDEIPVRAAAPPPLAPRVLGEEDMEVFLCFVGNATVSRLETAIYS